MPDVPQVLPDRPRWRTMVRVTTTPVPDVLTARPAVRAATTEDVLVDISLTGVFHSTSRLTEPWGVVLPALPQVVVFHLMTSGRGEVEVDGLCTAIEPGQLLVVPHGTGHTIRSGPDATLVPLASVEREVVGERYDRMVLGGGGAPAGLVCGAVRFTDLAVGRLMRSLPASLLVDTTGEPWVAGVLDLIARESENPGTGSDVVTARLAEVLLVHAVRQWWDGAGDRTGWARTVRDPVVGPALQAFHADPGADWTLDRLARRAGVSRSGFAARFTALAGEPAMSYVTGWRMDLAARLLRDPAATLEQVAHRVGYGSAPAFHRAFRRHHGLAPGAWRSHPPDPLADALTAHALA
jgi:AraC-like DNA-binding protein/mannose-6-phosphate isomerase-like protein (cupin superfamily)